MDLLFGELFYVKKARTVWQSTWEMRNTAAACLEAWYVSAEPIDVGFCVDAVWSECLWSVCSSSPRYSNFQSTSPFQAPKELTESPTTGSYSPSPPQADPCFSGSACDTSQLSAGTDQWLRESSGLCFVFFGCPFCLSSCNLFCLFVLLLCFFPRCPLFFFCQGETCCVEEPTHMPLARIITHLKSLPEFLDGSFFRGRPCGQSSNELLTWGKQGWTSTWSGSLITAKSLLWQGSRDHRPSNAA